jgi:hypothetical protein
MTRTSVLRPDELSRLSALLLSSLSSFPLSSSFFLSFSLSFSFHLSFHLREQSDMHPRRHKHSQVLQ